MGVDAPFFYRLSGKHMKKQLALGLALAVASTCSFADWVPTYLSGRYTSTVTYGAPFQTAQTVSYAEAMDASGHARGPVGAFADMALTLQPALAVDLNRAAAAGAASGSTFTGGTLTGGLNIALAAGANGISHVTMNGPSYTATYSYSGTKYLVHYTCTLRATMANLQIAGSFNTATSQLDASQTGITFTPQSNASCSTAIDWVPIFGDWAARIATGVANSTTIADLNAFQNRTLQSVLPGAPQYLGFNATIPSGVFMFNGVDMGAYIKNNSATLLGAPGSSVAISIGVPQAEGYTGPGLSLPPPSFTNTEFAITFTSFAGTLGYKVSSQRDYDYVYTCPRGTVRCIEP
jgi:hypothetical protein